MDSSRYLMIASDLASEFDIAKFQAALGEWRVVISEVFRQPRPDTHRQIAKEKILRYLDLQFERAASWTAPEADLLALIVRRLIELRFWTKYVEDEKQAEAFVYEAGIDARQVSEVFEKAYPNGRPVKAPEFPEGKRVILTRESEEEELLWKLSTKFVHSSSMAVIWAKDAKVNATYQHMFSVQILIYGWRIIEMLDSPAAT